MLKTKGKFALVQVGFSVKPNKDNGDLVDWKVKLLKEAREETRFKLDEDMPVLTGASKTNGLALEVTPMSEGHALPAVAIPVNLMGKVQVTEEGEINFTLRMMRNAMNKAGAGFDLITDASLCLDCVVGAMDSLEEQAAAMNADQDSNGQEVGTQPLLTAPTTGKKTKASQQASAPA